MCSVSFALTAIVHQKDYYETVVSRLQENKKWLLDAGDGSHPSNFSVR